MRKLGNWLKHCSEAVIGSLGLLPAIIQALAESSPGKREFDDELKHRPEGIVAVLSFVLVVVLATIDQRLNPRISLSLFYLLVVAFASWFGGRKAGVFIAFASAFALFIHEIKVSKDPPPNWAPYWNMWMQIGMYLFAALLVSAVRNLTESLECLVRERTAELEHEIADRRQTEEQLCKTLQQFRQLAETITDAFWMRNTGEARLAYVSPAYEIIWGRACRDLYQNPKLWLEAIHAEDRERVAQAIETLPQAGDYNLEYRIVRPDGTLRWIRDRAFPIRDNSGEIVRVVGAAEDFTERRRMEREILEISDREQARIGQDLHDGLCQKLVSLAFDNHSLEQQLSVRSQPETAMAQQIGNLLDDVITEARAMSRGLYPVQMEADGLRLALQQLAASVSARLKVDCGLECPQPVLVGDNVVATHLYRIAQEAVNNAIKHGKGSRITIQLEAGDDWIELKISDNGGGIPSEAGTKRGLGLHTMEYRARTVGGALNVTRGPNGGTIVSCLAPRPPD